MQGITTQVRPASALISRPAANVSCSSSSKSSSKSQDEEPRRRRPSSVIVPHANGEAGGSNGSVPGYVNVTRNGMSNGNVGVVVVNPLFGLTDGAEESREKGNEVPDIQITVSDSFN